MEDRSNAQIRQDAQDSASEIESLIERQFFCAEMACRYVLSEDGLDAACEYADQHQEMVGEHYYDRLNSLPEDLQQGIRSRFFEENPLRDKLKDIQEAYELGVASLSMAAAE